MEVIQVCRARLEIRPGASGSDPADDVEADSRPAARDIGEVRRDRRLQVCLQLRGRRGHVVRECAARVVLVAEIDARIEVLPVDHEHRHAHGATKDGAARPDDRAIAPVIAIRHRNGRLAQSETRHRGSSRVQVLPRAADAWRDAHRVRVRAVLGSTIGSHAVPQRRGCGQSLVAVRCRVGGKRRDFGKRPGSTIHVRRTLDFEAIFAEAEGIPGEINAVRGQCGGT